MVHHFISDRWSGWSTSPYHQLNIAFHVGDDPEVVARNRRRLFEMAQVPGAIFMDQIHSTRIEYVQSLATPPPRCDGIITDRPNLPLAVMSADCYPVLLFDEKRKVVAALHAGRAGAMGQIVAQALQRLVDDFKAHQIRGIIAPGIGSCCYEVGPEILAQVEAKYIKRDRFLDIKGMIKDQLSYFGVQYYDYGICTCCNPNYYSYRREGRTGRFASLIWRSA
ncbi:MAG: peptidoglycan editing factor PgeF [Epsilonproteobacteria bacterium]|nr:peptidoglycan editing factor PgeF [Campylobacterota bacterium]